MPEPVSSLRLVALELECTSNWNHRPLSTPDTTIPKTDRDNTGDHSHAHAKIAGSFRRPNARRAHVPAKSMSVRHSLPKRSRANARRQSICGKYLITAHGIRLNSSQKGVVFAWFLSRNSMYFVAIKMGC